MRILCSFVMVGLMTALAHSAGLPAPQAVTEPQQITSKPDARVERTLTIEKLYMTRQIGGSTWSPDGKTVAFICNLSGRDNLWLVPAEGGWPTQLTVSDQRQSGPAWSPDGKWIAYTSDYDGDEQWDIFLVSPKTGQVVNITNTREIAERNPTWSPDGRYLAYIVKPKASSVFEIDVYDTVLRDVKHITSGTAKDLSNFAPIWSKDGKVIFYTQSQAKGTDSNIFAAEMETARSTLLTPHQGEKIYESNDVSPDGKHLLITSNAGNGYDNIGLLEIETKKIHWLTEDKWEISGTSFTPDGKSLVYTANVDGNVDVYLYDIATGKVRALPLPKGLNWPSGNDSPFTTTARACSIRTPAPPHPAICGSTRWPTALRINSRIRWSAACAPRTWSSRTSSTTRAKTASGRSQPSSMCPTTCHTKPSTPPSSTCTADPPRRP